MAKPKKKDEVTEIEDLQVKEVSIVDRPANLRTFLIVKRATEEETMPREAFAAGDDTGDHEIVNEEEETASEETEDVIKEAAEATAEAASEDDDEGGDTIDLLELTEDDEDAEAEEDDEEEAEADPEGEIQEILKAVTVAQAYKPLNAALQQMLAATNEAKKLGKKKMPKELAAKFRGVALALGLISGKGKVEAKKAEGDVSKTATAALQKLMTLVNTLKGMKQTEAFPGNLASEAKAIAGSISGLLATSPTASKKKQKAEAKVTKAEGNDDNPIVVIKAGRKMKKTRLAKLREAVTLLSSILKELEGEPMAKKEDEAAKKTEDAKPEAEADKVEKAEEETKPEAKEEIKAEGTPDLSEIKEGIAKLGDAISGLGDKVESITKRVGDLEGTAPESNADEDPPEEVKKSKSLWDGVIPDYSRR